MSPGSRFWERTLRMGFETFWQIRFQDDCLCGLPRRSCESYSAPTRGRPKVPARTVGRGSALSWEFAAGKGFEQFSKQGDHGQSLSDLRPAF